MRKRFRLKWWLVALLALVVAVAGWLLMSYSPIDLGKYENIQVGMTEKEVEAVLGGPAGDYETRINLGFISYRRKYMRTWSPNESMSYNYIPPGTRYQQRTWVTNHGRLSVFFAEDGRVMQKTILPCPWPLLIFGEDDGSPMPNHRIDLVHPF